MLKPKRNGAEKSGAAAEEAGEELGLDRKSGLSLHLFHAKRLELRIVGR